MSKWCLIFMTVCGKISMTTQNTGRVVLCMPRNISIYWIEALSSWLCYVVRAVGILMDANLLVRRWQPVGMLTGWILGVSVFCRIQATYSVLRQNVLLMRTIFRYCVVYSWVNRGNSRTFIKVFG
jgi:hypothetical protein